MNNHLCQGSHAAWLSCLSLIWVPVALQIVANLAGPVPDGLRVALVLSVWASLMSASVAFVLCVALCRWCVAQFRRADDHRPVAPVAW